MTSRIRPTTFGVELEAVLIYPNTLHEPTKSTHQDDQRVAARHQKEMLAQTVYDQLNTIYRAKCRNANCKKIHTFRLPLHDPSKLVSGAKYSKWTADSDFSVRLTDEERMSQAWNDVKDHYSMYGVEVISRVLNLRGTTPYPDVSDESNILESSGEGHAHAPHWIDELHHVTSRLMAFNKTKHFRCFVNSTSGLHVHLGRSGGLPVPTVRGMMSMFTAFERQVDSVLTTKRVGGYDGPMGMPSLVSQTSSHKYDHDRAHGFDSWVTYCAPISRVHLYRVQRTLETKAATEAQPIARRAGEVSGSEWLKNADFRKARRVGVTLDEFPYYNSRYDERMLDALTAYHVPGWLYLMTSAGSVEDLTKLWTHDQGGHGSSINFDNLDGSKKTIEIRCHGGSIDLNEIVSWVNLMGSMLEYIDSVTTVELTKNILTKWPESGFNIVDLARTVRADKRTVAFYRKVLGTSYAADAYEMHTKNQDTTSELTELTNFVEKTRRTERTRRQINEKIRHKFESGLYGMQSRTYVSSTSGFFVANSRPGRELTIRRTPRNEWKEPSLAVAAEQDAARDAAMSAVTFS